MPDDGQQQRYFEGLNKFQSLRARAFWEEVYKLVRGKSTELLSFEDIRTRLRLRAESYKGLQDIPLEQIVGSVGRYKDFTASFLPRTPEMRDRWSRVYASVTSMEGVPPIEVFKVGDVYFVRDGNHRVSVAKQLGNETIQAHVTELPTSVPIEPGMSLRELDAATAYAAFLDETQLVQTRPHHQSIELSEPSRYPELLGHIYLHNQVMEQALGRAVSTAEAATAWYDSVYRPAVTLIRKYDILGLTNEEDRRTEADVYLWMVDHLREARQQYGDETIARSFSHALVDYLAHRRIPVPGELLAEDDDSVILSRSQVQQALDDYRQKFNAQKASDDDASEPAAE